MRRPVLSLRWCCCRCCAGCDMVVLSPSGHIAEQQRDLLVSSTLLMLLIVVPVMGLTAYFAWRYSREAPGALRARLAPLDGPRAGDLGGAADDHHLPRGDHLDRDAPARPLPAARRDRRPAAGAARTPRRSTCRWWRSTGSGCSSTRSTASPPSTTSPRPVDRPGALPPDVAVGDERLLRAGAGRDDLRDAGDDLAAQRGDQRRRAATRASRATTRAPASRRCASSSTASRRPTSTCGSPRCGSATAACSTAPATSSSPSRARAWRRWASRTSTPTSSAASSTAASRKGGCAWTR